MRSNYKKLGQYIQQVNIKNSDLKVTNLLGVSITKEFIPSIANTVGTDMSKYKVVKKGQFTYGAITSRNGDKISIALLEEDEAIVSTSYTVFEVIDKEKLLPEYLMMWFRRTEFDRYARYMSHGSTREAFGWDEMCDVELPVPSIEKQASIVKEYKTITDRIKLNEQLNQKLEETAQAIYKEWFVDFEFPDENGKPYKSSGGEMEYCDELGMEVPKGWKLVPYTNMIDLKGGGTPSTAIDKYWDGEIPFFTPKDVSKSIYSISTEKNITQYGFENSSTKIYPVNTVFITARGTVGAVAMASKDMAMNQSCYAAIGKDINQYFVYYHTLRSLDILKKHANGGVFGALVTRDFEKNMILSPDSQIIYKFGQISEKLFKHILIKQKENHKLHLLKHILLSKMATIEG